MGDPHGYFRVLAIGQGETPAETLAWTVVALSLIYGPALAPEKLQKVSGLGHELVQLVKGAGGGYAGDRGGGRFKGGRFLSPFLERLLGLGKAGRRGLLGLGGFGHH